MVSGTLKLIHIFNKNCSPINVKNVLLINADTLCCEFYPIAKNSDDIKLEMTSIIGCFNGIFKDKEYVNLNIKNYAIRAFDKNDIELMYSLSTKYIAEFIGTSMSIEWFTRALFQENTEDFRLSQAKKIISEIENALREIVKIKLKEKFGIDWWEVGLSSKLGKDVKDVYFNQFGTVCTDGDILIAYTYTLQLKKIILTHFNLFKSYFSNPREFEMLMDNLNQIRREEAHNRVISQLDLQNLEGLHENLLSRLLRDLKSFQSAFLTRNWIIKIKQIMIENQYKTIYNEKDTDNELNHVQKFYMRKENIINLISYLDDIIIKLQSVIVPIYKGKLHQELLFYYEKRKELQQSLLKETLSLNNGMLNNIIDEIDLYERKMDEFATKLLLSES